MLKAALVIALGISACARHSPTPPASGTASGEGDAAPFVELARGALVGHRAPAVAFDLLDGTHVDLAQLLGRRPVYLKFWATWCVPCREQMPHLEAAFRAHGDRLAVFAIDVGMNDPIENVREYVASKQIAVPIGIDRDGSVAERFDLSVTPQHILIDGGGIVRYVGHAITPELERTITAVVEPSRARSASSDATAVAAPAPTLPPLALDDGSKLDLASRPHAPLALTFATLFCDTYIAKSRPAIGATCAAHARQVEEVHRAHPEVTWITVAFPVWTDVEDIRDYRKRLAATVPIGVDRGNVWFRKFGVRDTYTTILLDSAGAELGRATRDGAGLGALIAKAR